MLNDCIKFFCSVTVVRGTVSRGKDDRQTIRKTISNRKSIIIRNVSSAMKNYFQPPNKSNQSIVLFQSEQRKTLHRTNQNRKFFIHLFRFRLYKLKRIERDTPLNASISNRTLQQGKRPMSVPFRIILIFQTHLRSSKRL